MHELPPPAPRYGAKQAHPDAWSRRLRVGGAEMAVILRVAKRSRGIDP